MRSVRRRVVGAALVLVLATGLMVPGAGTARAQYPIDPPGDCIELLDLRGRETNGFVLGEVVRIIVEAACGVVEEVRGILQPGGIFLFSGAAAGGESFDSGPVALPNRLRPGSYRLVVQTEDGTYVRPFRVSVGVAPDMFDRLREAVGGLQRHLELRGAMRTDSRSSFEPGSGLGVEAQPTRLGTLQTRLRFSSRRHSPVAGLTGDGFSSRRHSPVAGLTESRSAGASLQTSRAPRLFFGSFSPFSL